MEQTGLQLLDRWNCKVLFCYDAFHLTEPRPAIAFRIRRHPRQHSADFNREPFALSFLHPIERAIARQIATAIRKGASGNSEDARNAMGRGAGKD